MNCWEKFSLLFHLGEDGYTDSKEYIALGQSCTVLSFHNVNVLKFQTLYSF